MNASNKTNARVNELTLKALAVGGRSICLMALVLTSLQVWWQMHEIERLNESIHEINRTLIQLHPELDEDY